MEFDQGFVPYARVGLWVVQADCRAGQLSGESHPHLLSHFAAARAKPSLPKCFVPNIRKLTLRRSPMV